MKLVAPRTAMNTDSEYDHLIQQGTDFLEFQVRQNVPKRRSSWQGVSNRWPRSWTDHVGSSSIDVVALLISVNRVYFSIRVEMID